MGGALRSSNPQPGNRHSPRHWRECTSSGTMLVAATELLKDMNACEIDTGATTKDVGTGDDCTPARKPLRWPRVVE